ncbi:hypothetical protein AB0F17_59450 [Nonomuraea sp. NPDC026600]|uniref:hypothetical protein n=1 Tax=Nonomuraea sp. NPDC026600 TaxID=3155363 RepID=UPI0033FECF25
MTADATALQHIWICTQNVGLIRADQIVTLSVDDGRQRGRDAEKVDEFGDDTLTAALRNGRTVLLAFCGTAVGWQAMAELAATIAAAAREAASADAPAGFVYPQTTADGRLTWTHSIGAIGTHTWPLGPTPTPRPPYEPPAEWPLLSLGTLSPSAEPAPGPRTSPTSRPDPPPTRARA